MIKPVTEYELTCDRCGWPLDGSHGQTYHLSVEDAREAAADNEWVQVGERDICWRCTEAATQRRLDRATPSESSDLRVVRKRFFSGPTEECPPLAPINHEEEN